MTKQTVSPPFLPFCAWWFVTIYLGREWEEIGLRMNWRESAQTSAKNESARIRNESARFSHQAPVTRERFSQLASVTRERFSQLASVTRERFSQFASVTREQFPRQASITGEMTSFENEHWSTERCIRLIQQLFCEKSKFRKTFWIIFRFKSNAYSGWRHFGEKRIFRRRGGWLVSWMTTWNNRSNIRNNPAFVTRTVGIESQTNINNVRHSKIRKVKYTHHCVLQDLLHNRSEHVHHCHRAWRLSAVLQHKKGWLNRYCRQCSDIKWVIG